jgi:hypothetical protein
VQAKRDEENIVHHTPSLCLQLMGPLTQDHVPWGKYVEFESNCPV